ncbi:MAG: N-6 DNA methylase [Phycisphaerales bacterium]|nr:N-6 DNA methylase [Phycisphaerales bacterium]
MALKKSELYSSLWSSCDELRGGMDASQYKDYVLVLLFVKYVSDKYAGVKFAPITIPKGASFTDMVALKGKSDIGDQINKKILGPLANANKLSDMPDFDDPTKLGTGKEKVERLTNLIAIFENPALDFSNNRADGDDILGDAYEYLMRHFATESGKSKGQFYTPAEVSRVIAHLLGIRHAKVSNNTTVYDPTCGSGSLLLKVGDEAAHGKTVKVTLYGQEKDFPTAGLARMNMVLHDQPGALIQAANTITNPLYKDGDVLKTFDYVVANPPFSDKRWSTGLDPEHDPYGRFKHYGVPPPKQGDYAYLLHIIASLKPNGKGACILPHGVLFRGNAESVIRKNLITRGYIKAIIGLPPNLFYGTGIPACIVVIDKEGAAARKGIFMIDASKGFIKDGNKNRLREQDIHKIVDIFTRQASAERYSRMVPVSETADPKNDYNLNLPRYIDSTEPEDLQDIDAHLRGGIPIRDIDALDRYWQIIPGVRSSLFKKADRPGYCHLQVESAKIKATIFDHAEFTTFNDDATKFFTKWKTKNAPILRDIGKNTKPKALIEQLAEDLLASFEKAPLLDPYDIYQHLRALWAVSMQDDVYLIVADGWKEAAKLRPVVEDKKVKGKEKPDLVAGKSKYKAELIPPSLVIGRYFAAEQRAIEAFEAELATVEQTIEELIEDNGGDDGLLMESRNEKDKITKASVKVRLDAAEEGGADVAEPGEISLLKQLVEHFALKDALGTKLSESQSALTVKVVDKYGKLGENEIKTLVVEDKWLATLGASVQGELDRVSQTLTGRVRELAERYASALPQLMEEMETLSGRVDEHLRQMGAVWN